MRLPTQGCKRTVTINDLPKTSPQIIMCMFFFAVCPVEKQIYPDDGKKSDNLRLILNGGLNLKNAACVLCSQYI